MSSNPYARAIPLQRAIAEKYVEEYMIKNKLSMEKLRKQCFEIVIDTMIFAQPTGIEPDGLCNDIATRPYCRWSVWNKHGKGRKSVPEGYQHRG